MANTENELSTDNVTEHNFVNDNKDSYGPIVNTDTLWKLAVAHRPDTSVSNYQVMMALFNINPNAFLRNDINTMVAGQYLRIPTLEQIREVAPYPYNTVNSTTTSNKANTDTVAATESNLNTTAIEPAPIIAESVAVSSKITAPQGGATQAKIKSSAGSIDNSTEHSAKLSVVEEQELSSAANVEASNANTDVVNPDVITTAATADNELDVLASENIELKESLSAVDDQLSYLQYEVAKAAQKQSEMDSMLIEQKRLLDDSKKREQRLLNQQQALTKQREGFLNNPVSYWSTTGVLAILVIILFVLVSRRKHLGQVDSAHADNIDSAKLKNSSSLKNSNAVNNNNTVKSVTAVTANNDVKEFVAEITNTPTASGENGSAKEQAKDHKEPVTQAEIKVVTPNVATEPSADAHSDEITVNALNTVLTLPENKHVESAFAKIDLSADIEFANNEPEVLSDADLLNTLVSDSPNKKQPSITDIPLQTSDDELDIEQIIDGMLDENTKPAKLRSTITGNEKPSLKAEPAKSATVSSSDLSATDMPANEQQNSPTQVARVNEINDYDDVEFDKLLEEISAQTVDIIIPSQANVVNINATKVAVAPNQQTSTRVDDDVDFIAIDKLIEESDEIDNPKNAAVDAIYETTNIDVGLDEFPEFRSDVKHVNVDDDKHGVNAKLDLAQVYIEIGDFDNAAVILKSVMKLGNSAQQQQAQTLLYSLK